MLYDFVNEVDRMTSFAKTFILNVDHWNSFNLDVDLKWKKYKFDKDSLSKIPKEPGIYAFSISNTCENIPENAYLIYVGIVGYKIKTTRTLNERFKEYLHEEKSLKRPLVFYTLNKWRGYIYFHFVKKSKTVNDLKKLETALCDMLLTPLNKNDFSGKIRKILNGVW